MAWWMDVVVVMALFVLALYGLLTLAGAERRFLTRRTSRRAEDLYPDYADKPKRRRFRDR
jgi:hypothetical protein